jgi:hypothetical protein
LAKKQQFPDGFKAHKTTKNEIDDLRKAIARDIKDGKVSGVSKEGRFISLYDAARKLCTVAVFCSGYRADGTPGHHAKTIAAIASILGTPAAIYSSYFEICRKKRHADEYDAAGNISEKEVAELLRKVQEFEKILEKWISANHPNLGAM